MDKDLLGLILTIVNSTGLLIIAISKLRPELLKLKTESSKIVAERESEIADTNLQSLEGAQISSTMLMQRIQELRVELDEEKRARRDDSHYFRRRLREAERESRDYRKWAASLAKQIIESGKVPVSFTPSLPESDPYLNDLVEEERLTKK